MSSLKVFIADSISQRGIDELTRDSALEANVQTGLSETQLAEAIPDFAALIIRSQTKVTAKILNAGKKLRVVGRAGVGVDNVDVETATRRGCPECARGEYHFDGRARFFVAAQSCPKHRARRCDDKGRHLGPQKSG